MTYENPLYHYIKNDANCLSETNQLPEDSNYILIHRDDSYDKNIFGDEFKIESRHLRIDKQAAIIDENESFNEYSSNLTPAHYTERYFNGQGVEKTLHVYFTIQASIIKVSASIKGESAANHESLKLNDEQIQNAIENAKWAVKKIHTLNRSRAIYTDKMSKEIEGQLADFYAKMNIKHSACENSVLDKLIKKMEVNDLCKSGSETSKTVFVKNVQRKLQSFQSEQKGSDLRSQTGENDSDSDDDRETKNDEQIAIVNSQNAQLNQAEIDPQYVESFIKLYETCNAYFSLEQKIFSGKVNDINNPINVKTYHENFQALILEYCSKSCDSVPKDDSMRKALSRAQKLISQYKQPSVHLYEFAKQGRIELFNAMAEFLQLDLENLMIDVWRHLAGEMEKKVIITNPFSNKKERCRFTDIKDENLAKLIKYFLECDESKTSKRILSQMYFFDDGPDTITVTNFEQELLKAKKIKAFLQLVKLFPERPLGVYGQDYSTFGYFVYHASSMSNNSMLKENFKQLIMGYLEEKGPTHSFYSPILMPKRSIIKHNNKQVSPYNSEIDSSQMKMGPVVLLTNIIRAYMDVFYDDWRLFNSFIRKYYEASSPLHALLHAEHFLFSEKCIRKARKLRFFPLWGKLSSSLSRLEEIEIKKSFHHHRIIIASADLPREFNENIITLYTTLAREMRGGAGIILAEMQQPRLFEALKDYYGEEIVYESLFLLFNSFLQEEIFAACETYENTNNLVKNMNKHNKDINELLTSNPSEFTKEKLLRLSKEGVLNHLKIVVGKILRVIKIANEFSGYADYLGMNYSEHIDSHQKVLNKLNEITKSLDSNNHRQNQNIPHTHLTLMGSRRNSTSRCNSESGEEKKDEEKKVVTY